MKVNLAPAIRLTIYVATGIGSLVVAYLATTGQIGEAEVALWSGLSAFVSGLAAFNTPAFDSPEG